MIVAGRAVASRSGKWRRRLPGIRHRVVDVVQRRVGAVSHHVKGKPTGGLRWFGEHSAAG